MSRINALWVIDHVCYDGSLHGGGRLYRHILSRFDPERFHIVPCMLRATETIREIVAANPVPVKILDKHKLDPTTVWALLRLIRKENIHILHLHCYGASTFGRLAGWLTGVPAIIHDYDTEVYFPYPWYLWFADRILAPATHGAIAPSPMVRHFMIRKRKISADRIRMLLHAVPREKYEPVAQERISEIRRSLDIDDDTRVIGVVTKLGPQRGNEYLLEAAREVFERFPNAILLIIYKPTYFHRLPNQRYAQVARADSESMIAGLEKLRRKLGVEQKVRLVEWPDDADPWVAACDFVVAPFLSERFSSVHLLEAMALGKPVVATNLGEQKVIIENGINGYLVSPGDPEELAGKILTLLTEPGELERLSRRARMAAEQYSVDAYVQKLQLLYAALATKSSGDEVGVEAKAG